MGWETTLSIEGNLVGIWHNYASSSPSLLFAHADFQAERDGDDGSPSVALSTSAGRALVTLAANGFSWDILLRDYTESRDFSIELACQQGLLQGRAQAKGDSAVSECRALFEQLANTPADEDLRVLAATVHRECTLLQESWITPGSVDPPTPLRDALLFPDFGDATRSRVSVEHPTPTLSHFILTRASDYFRRNHDAVPLIGWFFTMVLVLRHSPPESQVVFNLSNDPQLDEGANLQEYCESYWNDARGSLAGTARFYGEVFANLAEGNSDFARAAQFGRLHRMLTAASEEQDSHRKGRLLEQLIADIIEVPGSNLHILEKRVKHADEELDLVLRNDLPDRFWANFSSPLIIVECKNWRSKVDINDLRVLETKIDDRGSMCRVGVFVSLRGFSRPFLERVRALQSKGITVFPIEGEDLDAMIRSQATLPNWLKENGLRKLL